MNTQIIALIFFKISEFKFTDTKLKKIFIFIYSLVGAVTLFHIAFSIYSSVTFETKIVKSGDVKSSRESARQANLAQNLSVSSAEVASILRRNIFNLTGEIPDGEGMDNASSCPVEPAPSQLPYKIVGILYGGRAETSLVNLGNVGNFPGSRGMIASLGQRLPRGGIIADILPDRILLQTAGSRCLEYLAFSPVQLPRSRRDKNSGTIDTGKTYSENGFERKGNDIVATREWVNKVLQEDFTKTLEDMRAVPNIVGGQIKGFLLTKIRPDSVYAKMGLLDGDVVLSINDNELNDAGRAIQVLNSLRNESNIDMQLQRDGKMEIFRVKIQKK